MIKEQVIRFFERRVTGLQGFDVKLEKVQFNFIIAQDNQKLIEEFS